MTEPVLSALIVDWGGVLTVGLDDAMRGWATTEQVDFADYLRAMSELLGPEGGSEAVVNPVHALERGEIEVPHFEAALAARLRTVDGRAVPARGLLDRMFADLADAPTMGEVVRRVHNAGRRTALLSNSWGNSYPRESWSGMFDAVVISGEVGMRKPEAQIYLHTAELLGVGASACVFVDDMVANVRGAVDAGMVGVHHVSLEETVAELEVLFGLELA